MKIATPASFAPGPELVGRNEARDRRIDPREFDRREVRELHRAPTPGPRHAPARTAAAPPSPPEGTSAALSSRRRVGMKRMSKYPMCACRHRSWDGSDNVVKSGALAIHRPCHAPFLPTSMRNAERAFSRIARRYGITLLAKHVEYFGHGSCRDGNLRPRRRGTQLFGAPRDGSTCRRPSSANASRGWSIRSAYGYSTGRRAASASRKSAQRSMRVARTSLPPPKKRKRWRPDMQSAPRGTLKVNVPVSFGVLHIVPALDDLLRACPELHIDMTLDDGGAASRRRATTSRVPIAGEPHAVARGAQARADTPALCASPEYLRRYGRPVARRARASQLHRLLRIGPERTWRFDGPDGRCDVDVNGTLRLDNENAVRQAALAGIGIALLPTYIIGADLAARRVARRPADYKAPETALFATLFAKPLCRDEGARVRRLSCSHGSDRRRTGTPSAGSRPGARSAGDAAAPARARAGAAR